MRRFALPAAALVAGSVLVTFPVWSAPWESSRYATGILRDMLILAILALSLDLLVGSAGMPSLGHAAYFGAGAYAAAIAGQRLGSDDLLLGLGAGQAGLATGHHLQMRGIPHVILDAGSRIGESWRARWDSLRLFTPRISLVAICRSSASVTGP